MAEGDQTKLTANNVIRITRRCGFRFDKNWRRIASDLNVPLNQISKQQDNLLLTSFNYEDAFEECVDYWMKNETATWDKFIYSIAKFEPETAEKVKNVLEGKEYSMLDTTSIEGPVPVEIPSKLLAEGILQPDDDKKLKDVHDWDQVIQVVRPVFENDPKQLITFAKLLLHYEETTHVGRSILQKPRTPVLPISPTYESKFDELMFQFGSFMESIRGHLMECIPSAEELKTYVGRCNRDLKPQMSSCETINDILSIIEEKCTIINVVKMEKIAEKYKCKKALDQIADYNDAVSEFCNEIRLNICCGLSLSLRHTSQPLICERIRFVLQWEPEDHTFSEIRGIIWKAFEDISKEILVISADRDQSVSVICYIPHTLIDLAVLKAKQNLDLLKEMDVVSLSVGYFPIIEKEVKEISDAFPEKKMLTEAEIWDDSNLLKELHQKQEEVQEQQSKIKALEHKLEDVTQQLEAKEEEYKNFLHSSLDSCPETQAKLIADHLLGKQKELEEQLKMTCSKNEQLESILRQTRTKTIHLEEAKTKLNWENEQLKEALVYQNTKAEEQSTKLNKANFTIKELENALWKMKDKEKQLEENLKKLALEKKQLQETEQSFQMEKKKFKAQLMQIDKLSIEKKSIDDKLEIERSKINQLEEEKESIFGSRVPLLHDDWRAELQSPPVQTVMSNFSIYKKNEEDWYSPSFVSFPNGYEMCVHILANGQDLGQGTHLSLYVHLMAGKNDDLLSWPFQGEVKVQLINRRGDYDHYEQIIMFDDSSDVQACSRVINGIPIKAGLANRIGEGKTLFIPQDKLQTSTSDFLREDSIRVCIKEVIVHSSNSVSPVAPIPSQSDPLPPTILDFVIKNFSKRKRSNEECISEPYYSHKSGYKLSLLVYPNGRGKCKDKYISIFVHLMKGENDNKLTFPFRGEILTQIINWKNDSKNHAEQNIEFNEKTDPKGEYGARFTGLATLLAERQYHGYGFPNFLSHKFLEFDESRNSQYVSNDDSLRIRIVKITVHS